jgi:hypothetical protein
MSNPTERVEYVHISLRIPVTVRRALEKDAKRRHMNLNSLAANVLSKYITFDKIAEHVQAIPLSQQLFSGILEDVSVDHLVLLGRDLGPRLIRQTFAFLDLEYDVDGLIRHYFEPMSYYSRWYTFTVGGSGQNRRLMFEHSRG